VTCQYEHVRHTPSPKNREAISIYLKQTYRLIRLIDILVGRDLALRPNRREDSRIEGWEIP
jgi:hypothetical protein